MITFLQTQAILKGNDEYKEWCNIFNSTLPEFAINDKRRVAAFLAQTCHESNYYKTLKENLNYSAKALGSIWGRRFKKYGKNPEDYHRQPEKIANFVYANRMGNRDEASGDGWAFRGKGAIQCTGRENTTNFAHFMGWPVEKTLSNLLTKEGAVMSAIWYWNKNGLNVYADREDHVTLCKRINGGTIGLEDRIAKYNKFIAILDGKIDDVGPDPIIIRLGSRGDEVKQVQEALGLEADGIFGKLTELHVKQWQVENNLVGDGIVGPKTFKKLIG